MRQGLREGIKVELKECINGFPFANKKSHFDKASIYCLLNFVKMDTYLQDCFSIDPSEWDQCQNCELENVSQYYNLLYTANLPHNITELLLGQKEKIENYLIEEL